MTFDEIFLYIIPKKQETVTRFSGCVDLIEKYVRKFPTDENWLKFKSIATSENWQELEMVVHTLKGYSGNIGFEKLYQACSDAVKFIREKNYEAAKIALKNAILCGEEIEGYIGQLD